MTTISKLLFIASFVLLFITACEEQVQSSISQDETAVTFSIELDAEELYLRPERSYTLKATVTPVSTEAVKWTSDNPEVVSVIAGILTTKKEGEATITASIDDVTASCRVVVAVPEYKLIWQDDFTGTSLDTTKWNNLVQGGGGNGEVQLYTDGENILVKDGVLTITARKETKMSPVSGNYFNYTSASINTRDKIRFTYGKIEARISLPSGKGTWPAFWMMPNDSEYGTWPRSGEIDIMEHVGSDPRMISHAYHTKKRNTSNGQNWSQKTYKDNIEGEFHIYTLEWEEDYLDGSPALLFYVDGERTGIRVADKGVTWEDWPFDKDFYIILNVALGGTWGGTIDDSIFEDPANPVEMKVDWVRLYQRQYE